MQFHFTGDPRRTQTRVEVTGVDKEYRGTSGRRFDGEAFKTTQIIVIANYDVAALGFSSRFQDWKDGHTELDAQPYHPPNNTKKPKAGLRARDGDKAYEPWDAPAVARGDRAWPERTPQEMLDARVVVRRRARLLLERLGNSHLPLVGASLEHCQVLSGNVCMLRTTTFISMVNNQSEDQKYGYDNFELDPLFLLRDRSAPAILSAGSAVSTTIATDLANHVPLPAGWTANDLFHTEIRPFVDHFMNVLLTRAVSTPVNERSRTPADLCGKTDIVAESFEGVLVRSSVAPELLRVEVQKLQRLRDADRDSMVVLPPHASWAAWTFCSLFAITLASSTHASVAASLHSDRLSRMLSAVSSNGSALFHALLAAFGGWPACILLFLLSVVSTAYACKSFLLSLGSQGTGSSCSDLLALLTSPDRFDEGVTRPLCIVWGRLTTGSAVGFSEAQLRRSEQRCEAQLRVWSIRLLEHRMRTACSTGPALAPEDFLALLDALPSVCTDTRQHAPTAADALLFGVTPEELARRQQTGSGDLVEEASVPAELTPLLDELLSKTVDKRAPLLLALQEEPMQATVGSIITEALSASDSDESLTLYGLLTGSLPRDDAGEARQRALLGRYNRRKDRAAAAFRAATEAMAEADAEEDGRDTPTAESSAAAPAPADSEPADSRGEYAGTRQTGASHKKLTQFLCLNGWKLARQTNHFVYKRVVHMHPANAPPPADAARTGAGAEPDAGTVRQVQVMTLSKTPSDIRSIRNAVAQLKRSNRGVAAWSEE